jgi:hypothetical protein
MKPFLRVRSLPLLSFIALLPAAILLSQTLGTITGLVNDSTGAVVAGAKVAVRNMETNVVRTVTSNDNGVYNVPALNPGVNSSGSDVVTIPVSTKPGTYSLLACADDRNVVIEDNEGNNCRASTGQVQVKAPDLLVTVLSEPPGTAAEGSTFSVSDTTRNRPCAVPGAADVTPLPKWNEAGEPGGVNCTPRK